MSAAAGISVANIYYCQPILIDVAHGLDLAQEQVGNLPVLTQMGYGLGLFFLTPLGDKIDRKKLILVLQSLLILVLAGMSLVTNIKELYVFSLLTGVLSVATQVIMPMAASIATNKGKVVGVVFTGILIGILAARTFSGFIAEWFGWRYVYGISACMMLISSLFVWACLPSVQPQYKGNYISLLQSTIRQFFNFKLLRRSVLIGVLIFGAFSSFWTTLTLHLSGEPFYFQSDIIGAFGILAVGGAMTSSFFGKLADKSRPAVTQTYTISLVIISVLLVLIVPYSVTAFIITTLLLDIGVQATQVTNVAQIYTLDESAHSRINTVYMTLFFIGGAIGTWVGIRCWSLGGWTLVCVQMLLWSTLALLFVRKKY